MYRVPVTIQLTPLDRSVKVTLMHYEIMIAENDLVLLTVHRHAFFRSLILRKLSLIYRIT